MKDARDKKLDSEGGGTARTPEGRRTQMYKGVLELALMSLLVRGPQYGFKMLETLREEAGIELSEGTLYPLLYRLEKAALVKAEWQLDADGARPRKYYGLTDAGRRDLEDQRAAWADVSRRLNQFIEMGQTFATELK